MLLLSSLLLLPAAFAAPLDSGVDNSRHVANGLGLRSAKSSKAAAYFLNNDPAGSSIVALKIGTDGSLSHPVKTATNGYGAISVNGSGVAVQSDSLGSQNAVLVANDMLFTVNAGSNTVSLFAINPQDPYHPKLVGSPADTLGDFPISVDYSHKLKKACVLNGGAKAGVTCFSVDANKGLEADGPLRALPKSVIDETTPPSAPPGSAAQVLFNPESTAVFATIKGNPGTKPIKLGSLVAWPVNEDGCVSEAAPIVSQIKGLVLDFGFKFLSQSRIFLADPSFGASLLDIGANFKATQAVHTVLPGQKATCWTQAEPSMKTLYAIDAGQNVVYTLDSSTGALTGNITLHSPSPAGVFDSAIKSGKMYSLAGANGLFVTDLAAKKTQQFLDLSKFGQRQHYQGMAVWPSW